MKLKGWRVLLSEKLKLVFSTVKWSRLAAIWERESARESERATEQASPGQNEVDEREKSEWRKEVRSKVVKERERERKISTYQLKGTKKSAAEGYENERVTMAINVSGGNSDEWLERRMQMSAMKVHL